ncbi:Taurine dioxygenase [Paracidovorax avenae ATCC 19860]|uniref:Taurine dioxygenase n=1 Tax=Paracidovorax avenae (strain ATCC 19860 / DSM 7227 / CCUG 15838 / JCM 20985 / LMG 2117 / NCPPB 1011) TaxID=643561 RepID=F0Q534_PARA1|nr:MULTISPECIES: TauD/TfdA family dioxygenase [Comamonadaceae]ADX47990.1 Taurine dioxygenase [Paracidovorax avenae ATCC 19860]MDA8451466.1 TauD/TfdA family dioxygenase [Acidovorax sp. GBBC 3297]MDA8460911.1 TauD/TfdA family dioxygenase [Acidovorax sp. GBBC 3333]MDA8465959.1 TauD/TfdA family dioxygenase [Acidovorax sp. GBBC 3332]MDA8470981.1 TauD/TfdA family dioxygenase [Acidovorax sp. GBBC 3299]
MSAVLSRTAEAFPPPQNDAPPQGFEIRPLPGAPLGAEVLGLDLSRPLGDADFARLHQAHLDHHVVVFRDQRITPRQHIDFSRRFGPLQIHVLKNFQLADHPEILVVSNIKDASGQPIGLGDAGHYWHSDLSYKERPSLGSLLHAQELPGEGGDTLFADQHAAYDALPAALRRVIGPLRAEHSYLARYEELRARSPWRPALTPAQIAEVAPAVHPVVRTHPETGRRALFVNEHFTTRIVGLPEDESRALLAELFAAAVKPEFVYRHVWQPHDLVFWDNRSVQHLAAGTPDSERRKLYRTTVEGDLPL